MKLATALIEKPPKNYPWPAPCDGGHSLHYYQLRHEKASRAKVEELWKIISEGQHPWFRSELPIIMAYLDYDCDHYLRSHPALATLRSLFRNMSNELLFQMGWEEDQWQLWQEKSDEEQSFPFDWRASLERYQWMQDQLTEITLINDHCLSPPCETSGLAQLVEQLRLFQRNFEEMTFCKRELLRLLGQQGAPVEFRISELRPCPPSLAKAR